MKRIDLFIAAMLIVIAMSMGSIGCVGTIYKESMKTENGTLTIGGRTGFFGTDQGVALYEEKMPANVPNKLVLQKAWSRQATTQEYDQKCPDPKQLKNIRTRTENVAESWAEEVPNPHKRAPQVQLIGGTNPSVGNVLLPAAAMGAGIAFSGGTTNMIQGGASAVSKAKGGNARQSQKQGQTSNNLNINSNRNNNDINIKNKSGSSSSSSATGVGVGVGVGN